MQATAFLIPTDADYKRVLGNVLEATYSGRCPPGSFASCTTCGSCKCDCTACGSCRCTPCKATLIERKSARAS